MQVFDGRVVSLRFHDIISALTDCPSCRSALRPYYIPPETAGDCRTWLYECHHDSIVQLMLVLESVTLLLYLVLFLFYLARAFRQLSFRNVR